MPRKRDEWQKRIKGVEREYTAMKYAIDFFHESITKGTKQIETDLKLADFKRADARLEATYIIRLFSEFEYALTDYLDSCGVAEARSANQMINDVKRTRRVSEPHPENAHIVRSARNQLVHRGGNVENPITITIARSYLCTFLSWLPPDW